jgi:protein tyrosine phosphatase
MATAASIPRNSSVRSHAAEPPSAQPVAPEKTQPQADPGRPVRIAATTSDAQVSYFTAQLALARQQQVQMAQPGRLEQAFQQLAAIGAQNTAKASRSPLNASKQRYRDIVAYDATRVPLHTAGTHPGADYINANYVHGYKLPKAYIAAQGPLPNTIADFWRMVWEQGTAIIVMVAQVREGNRVKCEQYWPSPQAHVTVPGFKVESVSETALSTNVVRRQLRLIPASGGDARTIFQLQMISWPDHGSPQDPNAFLELHQVVAARGGEKKPPLCLPDFSSPCPYSLLPSPRSPHRPFMI